MPEKLSVAGRWEGVLKTGTEVDLWYRHSQSLSTGFQVKGGEDSLKNYLSLLCINNTLYLSEYSMGTFVSFSQPVKEVSKKKLIM